LLRRHNGAAPLADFATALNTRETLAAQRDRDRQTLRHILQANAEVGLSISINELWEPIRMLGRAPEKRIQEAAERRGQRATDYVDRINPFTCPQSMELLRSRRFPGRKADQSPYPQAVLGLLRQENILSLNFASCLLRHRH
jgi:hypothetical protein